MGKKLFLVFLILTLTLSSCTGSIGHENHIIRVGQTYNEVISSIEDKQFLTYDRFMFFENKSGMNVVVEFNDSLELVTKIAYYEKGTADNSSVSRVKVGMTPFEVVELIGLPSWSLTFGLSSLDFEIEPNTAFRVIWDGEMKVLECYEVKYYYD